jgi:hypothetical protein
MLPPQASAVREPALRAPGEREALRARALALLLPPGNQRDPVAEPVAFRILLDALHACTPVARHAHIYGPALITCGPPKAARHMLTRALRCITCSTLPFVRHAHSDGLASSRAAVPVGECVAACASPSMHLASLQVRS